ncbi:putative bifunctional diguanylate cyclase/phosphodiesterase [Sodalinema gerasimenkoae]|uniref:putative bifunctional diguanylate cyclase/phosphodiesterase n=1 Tax=Sodalinema gerasimenkoae TaxID=2862348 RepID=UPI0013567389|nr:bifunctional diguanylate cyclase/phosphodiesterase [Sodalinema gerasimenkoae]
MTVPIVLAIWHGQHLLQNYLSDSQLLQSLRIGHVHLEPWISPTLAALLSVLLATALLFLRRLYRWVRRPRRDRSAVEFALDRERLFNHTLIEANPAFVVAVSPEGEVLRMNESMLKALGYRREDVLGQDYLSSFVPPCDRPHVQEMFQDLVHVLDMIQTESSVMTRDGEVLWVAWHGRAVRQRPSGACEFILGIGNDITDRQRTIQALATAEAKYRSIFENAIEGIFQISPEGYYLSANPALASILGYDSPEHLISQLDNIDRQLYVDSSRRAKLLRLLQTQKVVSGFEAEVYRRDGSVVWISEDVRAVRDDQGLLLYYEGSVVDITERKRTEQRLRYNASHDELTGLWNRGWFLSQVERSLRRSRRHEDYRFAVLFLDLDNFKGVNDSLGHVIGDRLLLEIAHRLELCLRPGDTLARLGGDEFTILMENTQDLQEAIDLAQRLQQSLQDPLPVENHHIFTQVSIGIAPAHPGHRQPQDLLQDADIALYRAKKQKPAEGYVVFDRTMRSEAVRRLQLETDLRGAIERNELKVVYQPIVCLDTLKVSGFEALVRWRHSRYGNISPSEFIPIAEESGSIQALGAWVLRTAGYQLRHWQQTILGCDLLSMSINLSGKQLSQAFISQLDSLLADTQLDGRTLKLEITETALMEDVDSAIVLLEEIQDRHVVLCLDDFGTGYCSLNYLHRFPIQIIKLDRSFVERLFNGDGRPPIAPAIVNLAQHLQICTIAEGIENPQQLKYLQDLGCNYGQGYWFSRPLDAQRAEQLLQEDLNIPALAG